MIRGVLFDLGGVLYVGDRPLPGAREALISLRAAGIPMRFITNTTRLPRNGVVARLAAMNLKIPAQYLFTPAQAARSYLAAHQLTPHLLVHPRLHGEFADLIKDGPANAVLMGDAGHAFTYETLNTAFRLLLDGAPLLAMGKNRYFKERDGLSLDIGPFVVALEYAADVDAVILGKPAPDFFLAAVASLGLPPEEVVMIGDDAAADVGGALAAGLQGILVRTGKYRPGDEAEVLARGARVFANVDEAVDYIL
ncbi:MAG: TIGR01458 family HAD-type hydrolase [Pseudomonadota bacterium]|nr:TIGR01458 family HAD-type hydrolase [Pseudomonadota bacterium]